MKMIMLPRIECADGFTMSVQAREQAYCEPRSDEGPWSAVEVGFHSEKEGLLMKLAESPSNPTGPVYGWVPVEVISEVIAKRGGTNASGAAVLNALRNGGVFLDRFRE